jgi:DNA repair protein RecN (Recombination protein N)
MLASLEIRNYALISQIGLEFEPGLTVLTGETGAGKSILIEALGLVLGERADSAVIGPDHDESTVTALFRTRESPAAKSWLEENGLGEGDECSLRRLVYRDGRPSRAYINGHPVTLQMLCQLSELLVDLHGQHEHQSLTRRDAQMTLLDAFGGLSTLAQETQSRHRDWREARLALEAQENQAQASETESAAVQERLALLESLDPRVGEFESLAESQKRIDHLERIRQGLLSIRKALAGTEDPQTPGCEPLLHRMQRELRPLLPLDSALEALARRIEEAAASIGQCEETLDQYENSIEIDAANMEHTRHRFDRYQEMAYRFHLRPEDLPGALEETRRHADTLARGGGQLERCREAAVETERRYQESALELSQQRHQAASRLEQAVNNLLPEFGMAGACLSVAFEPVSPGPRGLESIRLDFRSHTDQPFLPLAKVASGGELSRLALALQLGSAHAQWVPTLIFDEIDSGIGGRVAERIGLKLRALAGRRQVFCITHLPQVACQGHHHFQVLKDSSREGTRTRVSPLDEKPREREIARMLAGEEITEAALRHAHELIGRAQRTA